MVYELPGKSIYAFDLSFCVELLGTTRSNSSGTRNVQKNSHQVSLSPEDQASLFLHLYVWFSVPSRLKVLSTNSHLVSFFRGSQGWRGMQVALWSWTWRRPSWTTLNPPSCCSFGPTLAVYPQFNSIIASVSKEDLKQYPGNSLGNYYLIAPRH